MMTLQIPTLLALTGCALLAIAVFAPRRVPQPSHVALAASPTARTATSGPSRAAGAAAAARWPQLVDARAAGCDSAARLALISALADVRGPWADAILYRALEDEPDETVRDAVRRALVP